MLVIVVAIIGSVLIYVLESYQDKLNDWLVEDSERIGEKLDLLTAVMAVLCLLLIIGSVYLWRIGRAVIAARRFPPPGTAVVRDTPVVTGSKAVVRGHLIQISAFLGYRCHCRTDCFMVGVPFIEWRCLIPI